MLRQKIPEMLRDALDHVREEPEAVRVSPNPNPNLRIRVAALLGPALPGVLHEDGA